MKKVKEFYELVKVLKESGYVFDLQCHNLVDPKNRVHFLMDMFNYAGNIKPIEYTWLDEWLTTIDTEDIGKFCKFWDEDVEPDDDSSDCTYAFLKSINESNYYPYTATDLNEYRHYHTFGN